MIDYRFHYVSNADNEVVRIHADLRVKAIGASYRNGFGFLLPIPAGAVSGVTGQRLTRNLINLSPNGTEQGQPLACIMVFDDAFDILPRVSSGIGVNTQLNDPYRQPDSIKLTIQFAQPMSVAALGLPPYNSFIFVNGDRGKEVHLPGQKPSALANASFFNTLKDNTMPSLNRYYQTAAGLPFALHLPTSFEYPTEKIDLVQAYPMVVPWVNSGGQQYYDWFMDRPGYRNTPRIYKR